MMSLFSGKEMQNTKLQRWAILLAEFGAKIKYLKGSSNTRADMLSRLPPNQISVIDSSTPYHEPELPADTEIKWQVLPTVLDHLNLQIIQKQQSEAFPDLITQASPDHLDSDYTLIDGVLYSTATPHAGSASYPRLGLPPQWHDRVICRAHTELGHLGADKTLYRVREAYVWPHMCRDIKVFISKCPTCLVRSTKREKVPLGTLPLPAAPNQVVGIDLIGPLVTSSAGNRYVLCLVCHTTGWAEAYPIQDKTNQSVWQAFSRAYLSRMSTPEILISDQGKVLNSKAFKAYLASLGISHRTTTSYHPACNGLVERFNRTLKQLLAKACNNSALDWEDHLADVLYAHRISVSATTGFSPFFLMYGRRPRAPLKFLVHDNAGSHPLDNDRLMDMSFAWQQARQNTEDCRRQNRERIARQANAGEVKVGYTVIVLAPEPVTLTSKWDPQLGGPTGPGLDLCA